MRGTATIRFSSLQQRYMSAVVLQTSIYCLIAYADYCLKSTAVYDRMQDKLLFFSRLLYDEYSSSR